MNHTIYLGGGCFWGVESYFQRIPGVVDTEVGYSNGTQPNPSYEDVCRGSGHVETVKVTYDTSVISLPKILQYFLRIIDPFSINKQGNDVGVQYRSGVYYETPDDKAIIEATLGRANSHYKEPFAIEVLPLASFYPAETYHQDYLDKNPNGYCHINVSKAYEPLVDESDYERKSDSVLREELSDLAYSVTQQSATERPFSHGYTDEFRPGIYVDVTSGEPLFISAQKFDSGCGWPSFAQPINSDVIRYYQDDSLGHRRIEVRSRIGDAHLGHVFEDGPQSMGGLRYCINGAALRFIPLEKLEEEGYGSLRKFVERSEALSQDS